MSPAMAPAYHQPLPLQTDPPGTSYNLILDHVFSKPQLYDIPLRSMYAIQSVSLEQTQAQSPILSDYLRRKQEARAIANADFASSLMQHLATLPSQPCSLPPSFTTAFVRKCFAAELTQVDFSQALTGIDYLKDLDTRRKRDFAAALRRLGLDRNSLAGETRSAPLPNVVAAGWVRDMIEKEKKVDAFYTQLFVGLRRWTLINEMSLQPFHKHNCHALLNTLYPPVSTSQPTAALTPQVMRTQRESFLEYIKCVELYGTPALEPLILHGRRRDTDQTGWPAVHATLDAYLIIANAIIHECAQVTGLNHFAIRSADAKHDRKKDSGVSFASSQRPSFGDYPSSTSSTSLASSAKDSADSLRSTAPPNHSKLERLASELRRIRTRHKRDADAAALAADRERMRQETLDKLRGGLPYASPQMVTKSPPSTWPQPAPAPVPVPVPAQQSRQSLAHEPPHHSDPDMPRARTMRRLRSMSDIRTAARSLSRGRASDSGPGVNRSSMVAAKATQTSEAFDKDEMMRQRLIWEAKERRQAETAKQS